MSGGAPLRVAAIDLGKARAGVAVADELGMFAHPRPFLEAKSRKALLEALVLLSQKESIERFVVGLPLDSYGGQGPAAQRAIVFAQELANATGVSVELVDERFSTVEASRHLRESGVTARAGKGLVDGAAAAVILQHWLDRRQNRADE
jgi:putative Holliday junction resolvase